MSTKRKKKLKERAERQKAIRERIVSARRLNADEVDIRREVDHIVGCAQARDARCVTLGTLVLFSTQSGDAWMLEPADELAVCLAIAGEEQEIVLVDTETRFAIGWNKSYEIRGEFFVTLDHYDARRIFIQGYPIPALVDAIARCER